MTSRRGHQTPNWPRGIVGLLAHIMLSLVSATRFRQAVVVGRATVRRCSDMEPLTQSGCQTSSHCDGRRRGGAKPAFLGPTPKARSTQRLTNSICGSTRHYRHRH
jgi:hypothetical protein